MANSIFIFFFFSISWLQTPRLSLPCAIFRPQKHLAGAWWAPSPLRGREGLHLYTRRPRLCFLSFCHFSSWGLTAGKVHSFCLSAKRCSCAVRPSHTGWGLITETFPSKPAGTDWPWLFLQSKAPKAHREPEGQEFQKPVRNSRGCRAGWSHPGPLDGSASPRMRKGCPKLAVPGAGPESKGVFRFGWFP